MAMTEIEITIETAVVDFPLCDIIKKICEDHDYSDRTLRIKVFAPPNGASEIRKIVKEELDRRTEYFISGFEKLNKAACHPSMTEFLHKQFPHNFKAPSENVSPRATNPDAQ